MAVVAVILVMTTSFLPPSKSGVRSESSSETGKWIPLAVGPSAGGESGMAYDNRAGVIISISYGDAFALNRTGSRWTKLAPVSHPTGPGLVAYDSESDRVVYFGGGSGQETWTFDYGKDAWENKTPAVSPGVHRMGGLAYDSRSDRTVLFGGTGDAGRTNDTWSYDVNANTWTELKPVVKPPARSEAAMAYDVRSDRILMCGGYTDSGPAYDGWTFDVGQTVWTYVSGAACQADGHSMAYDSGRDRVVLLSGQWPGPSDILVYNASTPAWTLLNRSAMPMGRQAGTIVYDGASDHLILFGGRGGTELDDTWSYDFSTDRWSVISWGTPKVLLHGLAYDQQSRRTILVAGIGCTQQMWAYDSEIDAWTNMRPAAPYGSSPQKAVAYDGSLNRVICFDPGTLDPGTTWAYDFGTNSWTDFHAARPNGLASPAGFYGMAYDSESNRVVLLGLSSASPTPATQAWAFDSGVWRAMPPTSGPPPRQSAAMAYDEESDRIILFGGQGQYQNGPPFPLGDTWAYDFNTNVWTNMTPPVGPSARYRHAMAYDRQADRVILYGGQTRQPYQNDTWAYDFNTDTWTNLTTARNPGPRPSGSFMAYDSRAGRIILFEEFAGAGMSSTWGFDLSALPRTAPPPQEIGPPYLEYGLGLAVVVAATIATLLVVRDRRRPRAPPT